MANVGAWLATQQGTIAMEVLNERPALGELVFIGRHLGATSDEQSATRVRRLLTIAAAAEPPSPAEALELFGLFRSAAWRPEFQLERLELGVTNAWHSSGSVQLWHAGQEDALRRPWRTILRRRPAWRLTAAPVALEAAYRQPVHHWLAYSCSERGSNGLFHLRPQAVLPLAWRLQASSGYELDLREVDESP